MALAPGIQSQLLQKHMIARPHNALLFIVPLALAGQALLLGRWELLVYALVFLGTTAAFVRWYEEPTLRDQFGAEYETYRRAVPGWWPRFKPWHPPVAVDTPSRHMDPP